MLLVYPLSKTVFYHANSSFNVCIANATVAEINSCTRQVRTAKETKFTFCLKFLLLQSLLWNNQEGTAQKAVFGEGLCIWIFNFKETINGGTQNLTKHEMNSLHFEFLIQTRICRTIFMQFTCGSKRVMYRNKSIDFDEQKPILSICLSSMNDLLPE